MNNKLKKYLFDKASKAVKEQAIVEIKRAHDKLSGSKDTETLNLFDSGIIIDLKRLKLNALKIAEAEVKRII